VVGFWQAHGVADQHPVDLLDDGTLAGCAVVANCEMNRQRQLTGVNSYTRELGFDPVDVLTTALAAASVEGRAGTATVAWLDLCCGSGRALIQAADRVAAAGTAGAVDLVGVDLVDAFDPVPARTGLQLVCAPVLTWTPTRSFDLITSVHGMHYLGDKLALLTHAAGWLTPTGRFVADLDLASIRRPDGRPAGRRLAARLRAAGFAYDPRRRRIGCTGRREVNLPYTYLGADHHAGPNYTGQPAVNSYYREDHPGQSTGP
jgi:SAM-dependent methyltransferase